MNANEKTLYSLFQQEATLPEHKLIENENKTTLLKVIDRPDIEESVV